jgi:hypothetical protein
MHLKVGTFFVVVLFIGTACAFSVPVQGRSEPEAVSDPVEFVADEATVVPVSQTATATKALASPTPAAKELEAIVLPISIYILDDSEGRISSARTVEQLKGVYEDVNGIWAQAGIVIEVQGIHRVSVSPAYLQAITVRDFRFFFQAIGNDIALPKPSLLNGFYAQDIGGPNGIAPFGTRAFFVTDQPSVHSERVSSHEIGHILGLHHTLVDKNRLMFPGTNGMQLTEEEIVVARYAAKGLLDGLR